MTEAQISIYGSYQPTLKESEIKFSSNVNDKSLLKSLEGAEWGYVYISHLASDESEFLPIRKKWSAGSRVITNEYHLIDDEGDEDFGKWMLDGVLSFSGSPTAQKQLAQFLEMCRANQKVERKVWTCGCGDTFLSRQGRYGHAKRNGCSY